MTEREAAKIVKSRIGDYRVKLVREMPQVYLFMCESSDSEMMPSKIAVAINKKTQKIGSSIMSYEDAIKQAL